MCCSGVSLWQVLEGLLPYSERHLQRISKLIRGSYFVDYIIEGMSLTPLADEGTAAQAKLEAKPLARARSAQAVEGKEDIPESPKPAKSTPKTKQRGAKRSPMQSPVRSSPRLKAKRAK